MSKKCMAISCFGHTSFIVLKKLHEQNMYYCMQTYELLVAKAVECHQKCAHMDNNGIPTELLLICCSFHQDITAG